MTGLRDEVADEIAGIPCITGYYAHNVGIFVAQDIADAILPVIERHTAALTAERDEAQTALEITQRERNHLLREIAELRVELNDANDDANKRRTERDRARDLAQRLEAENAAALALHRSYWIDSDGRRHESTGIAYCGQFDGCDGTDENPCPIEEHEVPVCCSCGTYDDYGEAGFRRDPCPTARALLVSELAEVAQERRTE